MAAKTLLDALCAVKEDEVNGITLIHRKKDVFISYSALYRKAFCFYGNMTKMGLQRGNEVIINTESTEEFIVSFWACIMGGFIAVPVSCSTSDGGLYKVINIWKKLKAPYIIASDKVVEELVSFAENLKEEQTSIGIRARHIKTGDFVDLDVQAASLLVEVPHADDIAFIQFSSGSTGAPKGVMLKHSNLIANIKAIIKGLGKVTKQDSCLSWIPLTHDMGLIGFHLSPLYVGVNQIIMSPMDFMKRPMMWLGKVSEYKCSVINSPNFGYEYFFKMFKEEEAKHWDLSNVRVIFNGAEPINYDSCIRFLELLRPLHLRSNAFFPVYGMAEASLAVTFPDVENELQKVLVDRNYLNIGDSIRVVDEETGNTGGVTFVKLGQSIDYCNYRITDNHGETVRDGVVGNIEIFGDNVTSGYYEDEDTTRQYFSADGWLKTGDIGFTIDDNLVVVGRSKEVIIVNGDNYYPDDIERMIAHGIKDERFNVAAVGILDYEKKKENIIVFIKHKKNMEEFLKVKEIVNRIIKIYLGTSVVALPIPMLPKTTSGKVQRVLLKERYMAGEFKELEIKLEEAYNKAKANQVIEKARTETETKLEAIFEKTFPGIEIGIYENYLDYGINSMHLVSIINQVQKEFNNGNIEISSLFSYQTIHQLAKYIDEQQVEMMNKNQVAKDSIYDLDEILGELQEK